jgi:hypothetical protein
VSYLFRGFGVCFFGGELNFGLSRLSTPGHKAKDAFYTDVKDTYGRISARVKVLQKEEADKEEAERQEGLARLQAATMEDGSYKLPVGEGADEDDVKRADVFDRMPKEFQSE